MNRKLSSDEIQNVLNKLEDYISDLQKRWDQENVEKKSWWKLNTKYLISSTLFLINSLDEIIVFVEGLIPDGQQKKETTLKIVSKLFDYIITAAFPVWLTPFSYIIKKIVIDVIIDSLINYIVSKYNNGSWNKEVQKNEEQK